MTLEIQRLLAAYATGGLTPEELQFLYAAALEDQEVFDALQHEEPLRDLLSHPASRDAIVHVLENPAQNAQSLQAAAAEPAAQRAQSAQSGRRWSWALAFATLAATGWIGFVWLRPAPHQAPPSQEIAAVQSQPALVARAPERAAPPLQPMHKMHNVHNDTAPAGRAQATLEPPAPAAPTPAALTPPPPPLSGEVAVPAVASLPAPQMAADALTSPAAKQSERRFARPAMLSGFAASSPTALPVRILRRDLNGAFTPIPENLPLAAGDTLRLEVTPAIAGTLTLFAPNSPNAGTPAAQVPVLPGLSYLLPDQPIVLTGPKSFVITLTPAGTRPLFRKIQLSPGSTPEHPPSTPNH